MHESVKEGGGHGGVAQVFAPVLQHAVGGDDDGAARRVALLNDGLQEFDADVSDAPGQEQIVQLQQVRLNLGLELFGLLLCACQPVAGELGVGLHVAHVVSLQRGLVGHCLGHKALAGAWLANDQRVGALADELQGVQLDAGAARQLRIETPGEVRQAQSLGQARAAPVQLVLQHGGEGLKEGLLGGLGLHYAGRQRLGDAGEAQFAQCVRSQSCSWLSALGGLSGGGDVGEQIAVFIGTADERVLLGRH